MKQRFLVILGSVLLVSGCLVIAYYARLVSKASILGSLHSIISDYPTEPFQKFQCPTLVNPGDKFQINAAFLNPTTEALSYSITLIIHGLNLVPATTSQNLTLPAGEMAELVWMATLTDGDFHNITVIAISDKDAALPDTFHFWPTSFLDGCGVVVYDGPLKYQQIPLVGIVIALIGGILLYISLSKRRNS